MPDIKRTYHGLRENAMMCETLGGRLFAVSLAYRYEEGKAASMGRCGNGQNDGEE
ncbi:hypothetical protein [Rhizobium phaseoli]|uniref:hypothetical protein n=1 Tax=Rhizobium phaseoli TaxID=396 RepID=UPI001680C7CC|nr:hypothetical protein [Rhizobium phaseoli]